MQGTYVEGDLSWQAQSGTHASLKATDVGSAVAYSGTDGPVHLIDAQSDDRTLYGVSARKGVAAGNGN